MSELAEFVPEDDIGIDVAVPAGDLEMKVGDGDTELLELLAGDGDVPSRWKG